MGLFDMFESFANGTLVDDMVGGLEKSIDQFERLVDLGEERLQSAANVADATLQKATDSAD